MQKPKPPKLKTIHNCAWPVVFMDFQMMSIKDRVAVVYYLMQMHLWLFEQGEK
jgi:hypothetical protein